MGALLAPGTAVPQSQNQNSQNSERARRADDVVARIYYHDNVSCIPSHATESRAVVQAEAKARLLSFAFAFWIWVLILANY